MFGFLSPRPRDWYLVKVKRPRFFGYHRFRVKEHEVAETPTGAPILFLLLRDGSAVTVSGLSAQHYRVYPMVRASRKAPKVHHQQFAPQEPQAAPQTPPPDELTQRAIAAARARQAQEGSPYNAVTGIGGAPAPQPNGLHVHGWPANPHYAQPAQPGH